MGKKSREDAYRRLEASLIKMNTETRNNPNLTEETKNRIIMNNLNALEAARKKMEAE